MAAAAWTTDQAVEASPGKPPGTTSRSGGSASRKSSSRGFSTPAARTTSSRITSRPSCQPWRPAGCRPRRPSGPAPTGQVAGRQHRLGLLLELVEVETAAQRGPASPTRRARRADGVHLDRALEFREPETHAGLPPERLAPGGEVDDARGLEASHLAVPWESSDGKPVERKARVHARRDDGHVVLLAEGVERIGLLLVREPR